MTADLVAFLNARLDEDEEIARDPMAETWTKGEAPSIFVMGNDELVAETAAFADARHIARHDPARVLAEVDAKRRIMAECRHMIARGEPERADAKWILQVLALPYADHPDYREEWRP